MFSESKIREISNKITNRPLSKGASQFLYEGCQAYKEEGKKYLKHDPTTEEAMKMIEEVLSKLKYEAGEITVQEVKSTCDDLPYPLNLWFC
jgi:hypothetical protein